MQPCSVFVLLLEGNRILLVENPAEELPGGMYKRQGWSPPGGKMKPEDRASQNETAYREVKEETQLEIDKGRIEYLHHEDRGTHLVWFVAAPIIGGRPKAGNGILDVQWSSFRFEDGNIIFEAEKEGRKQRIYVYTAQCKRIMLALAILAKKPMLKFQHVF